MTKNALEFGGLSVDQLYTQISSAGVSERDAALIAARWIGENIVRYPGRFSLRTAFPATVPGCEVTFARTFAHADWVDGQSVVQAEETPDEAGFNDRFHRIEDDIDALGRGLETLSGCVAAMRRDLRGVLDEIVAELTTLRTARPAADTIPEVRQVPDWRLLPEEGPVYLGQTKWFNSDVHVWKTSQGVITLPSISPVVQGPGDPRVQRTKDLGMILHENRDVQDALAAGMTKKELVEQFGGIRTSSGRTLADLVTIVPDDTRFNSADEVLGNVAEREAAALRTSEGALDTLHVTLGSQDVGEASIDKLGMVPSGAVDALANAGIRTLADLAAADPRRVQELTTTRAIGASGTDTAGWQAAARVLSLAGGRRFG